jgi:hypothetical protein
VKLGGKIRGKGRVELGRERCFVYKSTQHEELLAGVRERIEGKK